MNPSWAVDVVGAVSILQGNHAASLRDRVEPRAASADNATDMQQGQQRECKNQQGCLLGPHPLANRQSTNGGPPGYFMVAGYSDQGCFPIVNRTPVMLLLAFRTTCSLISPRNRFADLVDPAVESVDLSPGHFIPGSRIRPARGPLPSTLMRTSLSQWRVQGPCAHGASSRWLCGGLRDNLRAGGTSGRGALLQRR
jgi:hypothetical protein